MIHEQQELPDHPIYNISNNFALNPWKRFRSSVVLCDHYVDQYPQC
jgi:hypothetical protein